MSNNLCKYKNIVGEPNKGFHVHIFGFAIFDLLATMLIAFFIMLFLKLFVTSVSHSLLFGIILLVLLIIAEVTHKLFCIT